MSKRAKDHKKFTVKTLRTLARNIEDQKFDYDPRDFKKILDEAEMYYTNYLSIKNDKHNKFVPKYKELTF